MLKQKKYSNIKVLLCLETKAETALLHIYVNKPSPQ